MGGNEPRKAEKGRSAQHHFEARPGCLEHELLSHALACSITQQHVSAVPTRRVKQMASKPSGSPVRGFQTTASEIEALASTSTSSTASSNAKPLRSTQTHN